jgi:predicted nucleic acid-binding protein
MPILVADTSPLQALHRGGALPSLSVLYDAIWLPDAVRIEMVGSLQRSGAAKVPQLAHLPWLRFGNVSDEDLHRVGALHVGPGARARFGVGAPRLRIDRPELEVILLAERLRGVALVEDREGLRLAQMRGVPVVSTADVLTQLDLAGVLPARAAAQRILATGYITPQLRALANG